MRAGCPVKPMPPCSWLPVQASLLPPCYASMDIARAPLHLKSFTLKSLCKEKNAAHKIIGRIDHGSYKSA
jgi:hypothetical protein